MDVTTFLDTITDTCGITRFTGVPDSTLRPLLDELTERYGTTGARHTIAADEGGAVGIAAGQFLATGEPSLVYMQNSGIGNAVNPLCSLANDKVYAIPALLVVGWRGKPGVHDEPQHVFQGEITLPLLGCLDIPSYVVTAETTSDELTATLEGYRDIFAAGRQAALVIEKGALSREAKRTYSNDAPMTREEALGVVLDVATDDEVFVSTTGKLSRELFELREARGQDHGHDFLTVGSMGHSSMIALGIAQAQPDRKVCVLDGDGAVLMHTGALAIIGSQKPENLVHILFDNEAHESVGGMPTVSGGVDWQELARSCGYPRVHEARNRNVLYTALRTAFAEEGTSFVHVRVNLESRSDLGRPTTTARQNRDAFMATLAQKPSATYDAAADDKASRRQQG